MKEAIHPSLSFILKISLSNSGLRVGSAKESRDDDKRLRTDAAAHCPSDVDRNFSGAEAAQRMFNGASGKGFAEHRYRFHKG